MGDTQADFSYNNGTAASPNIKAWTESDGTVVMQDFHSGGTVHALGGEVVLVLLVVRGVLHEKRTHARS